jgi:hypothetical protein
VSTSIIRIVGGILYFLVIFLGVLYLSQINEALALIFNMFMLGLLCLWLKRRSGYKSILWFFLGFFYWVFRFGGGYVLPEKAERYRLNKYIYLKFLLPQGVPFVLPKGTKSACSVFAALRVPCDARFSSKLRNSAP